MAKQIPPASTVLVVSRGDDQLLRFDHRTGVHFPQANGGVYAGHHPATAARRSPTWRRSGAIRAAQFLSSPRPAFGGSTTMAVFAVT